MNLCELFSLILQFIDRFVDLQEFSADFEEDSFVKWIYGYDDCSRKLLIYLFAFLQWDSSSVKGYQLWKCDRDGHIKNLNEAESN